MKYQEVLDYLFKQLPMYQRIGKAAYKADLSNTHALMDVLKHPHQYFKSIHVAGTNGKGSTCHMLASVLQENNLKVGLYTSPHLVDFRERIKINGKVIPKEAVISFVDKYKNKFEEIGLSFFEWTVGLAFEYFKNEKVDIAVIETGMGGRLDSTNVIHPIISVITNISYDHQQFLGNSLDKIAGEKAGIIKPNTAVIIGRKQKETTAVFEFVAKSKNSELIFASDLKLTANSNLYSHFDVAYQKENLTTVLATLNILNNTGKLKIEESSISAGIQNVNRNTGLDGRWKILQYNPEVIIDVAHNEDGIKQVMSMLEQKKSNELKIVWGMVGDKDVKKILNILPKHAYYYFCEPTIERRLNAEILHEQAKIFGLNGLVIKSPSDALHKAITNTSAAGLVFAGGSTFVVADIIKDFKK